VNFPDDSYGVEYTNSEGEVFFLDENCTPRHSIYEMKEYCRFNKLSEAEQVLMWGQKKFPSTVIKEG